MPVQRIGSGEERPPEIEGGGGPLGKQIDAALSRDIGKARGDIGPAGEADGLNAGADRRLCGGGIAAAIEQRCAPCRRHCGAGRNDHLAPPAGAAIDASLRRAGQDHGPPGFRRRGQRRDGVRQRMDDDDRVRGQCIAPK